MSAASFVTSVPVIPMAMPMSAFFSAGASFTPSPVIATMFPFAFSTSAKADLVLRRDAGDHADVVDLVAELLITHRGELGSGDRATLDPRARSRSRRR